MLTPPTNLDVLNCSEVPTNFDAVASGLAQRLLCESPPVHIALLRHLAA